MVILWYYYVIYGIIMVLSSEEGREGRALSGGIFKRRDAKTLSFSLCLRYKKRIVEFWTF